ncbi:MAG: hypothetical protein IKL90_04950 [Alphaproteobacteria bacterium]|nr:hypothetical protein [Alphaproteobacteria bacterium]MBR6730668.1 hypothetical protein [Alphaproteobacteria bacterium]
MSKKIKIGMNEELSALINPLQLNFDTAYIKQEPLNNDMVWSIYNEQGEKLGYAASREVAFAVVMQNEFIGLSVH